MITLFLEQRKFNEIATINLQVYIDFTHQTYNSNNSSDDNMNNQFKNKMVDNGATPKFNTGMFFCVHTNTSLVALEDCSSKGLSQEQTEVQMSKEQQDLVGVNSLRSHYEYEDQLIQRQDEIIKSLEQQISDAKQELIEKDKEITRLENDLEEISEELFLEMSLR